MYTYAVPLNKYSLAKLFTKIPCCDEEHHRDSGRGRRACPEPKTLLLHDKGDFALVHSESPQHTNYILLQGNVSSRKILLRMIVNEDASVPSGHSDLEDSESEREDGRGQNRKNPNSSGDGEIAKENRAQGEGTSLDDLGQPVASERISRGEDLEEWQVV